ncbi:hypothetical protein BX666DRAFT_1874823 [Dichotomocladium elegans]|nr:hypothetical protein BX666DRAFT_1874823 [Dichotomocladium elegans]
MIDLGKLKKYPISVLHIPVELIDNLRPADFAGPVPPPVDLTADALKQLEIERASPVKSIGDNIDTSLTCRTCNISFSTADRQDHRAHFATDWHRYNIKRKLTLGLQPVSMSEFHDMLADIAESISGSESDNSSLDCSSSDEDDIDELVDKQQAEAEAKTLGVSEKSEQLTAFEKRTRAILWFQVNTLPPTVHIGVYRKLAKTLDSLKAMQAGQYNAGKNRLWTIIMVSGGHFAGAVIDVNKSIKEKSGLDLQQVKMIAHKTIHRYTNPDATIARRKQGGSQSANDNAKGAANSAGAQIRRYNEAMLQQEIRELLAQWKEYVATSELVFVHAPSNNRKLVYGYEGAVLTRENSASIPFPTRRPTLNELRRVFLELCTLQIADVDLEAVQSQRRKAVEKEERVRQQIEKSRSKPLSSTPVTKPKIAPEVDKLISLTKQGKDQVVLSHVRKHEAILLPIARGQLTAEIVPDQDEILQRFPSLLFLAAHHGHAALVSALVRDLDVDPTIQNEFGKTAYDIAKEKDTRIAFRRLMNDFPDRWDWLHDAHVPSPLTRDAELDMIEKERQRKERENERRRKIEEERQKREEARMEAEGQRAAAAAAAAAAAKQSQQQRLSSFRPSPPTSGRTLGGGSSNINTPAEMNMATMTPEARMRLEREMRARAAEERIRRLQRK